MLYLKHAEIKKSLSIIVPNEKPKMPTKVVVLVFSKSGVGAEAEAAVSQIKTVMELDQKNIFILASGSEGLYN